MISFLITILLLWLVYKYVPFGDKIVVVVVLIMLLRRLGVLPMYVII